MKFILLLLLSSSFFNYPDPLIPFRKGNKWGFADVNKNVIIKPKYKSVSFFYFDYTSKTSVACVRKGDKYIFINRNGKKIIDDEFDKAENFNSYSNSTRVTKNDSVYYINSKGENIRPTFGCGGSHSAFSYFIPYKKNGKIGFQRTKRVKSTVNKDSIIYIKTPAIWDNFKENGKRFSALLKDNKWRIVNWDLELVSATFYDSVITSENDRKEGQFLVKKDTKWGALNFKGEKLIDTKYYKLDYFIGNYAKAWLNPTFWFYIDKKGTEYYTERKCKFSN